MNNTFYTPLVKNYDDLRTVSQYISKDTQQQDVNGLYKSMVVPDMLLEAWRTGTKVSHDLVAQYQAQNLVGNTTVVDANELLPKRVHNVDNPFGSNPAMINFSASYNGNMRLTNTMPNLPYKLAILAGEMSSFSDLDFRYCWEIVQGWAMYDDFTELAKDFFTAKNYATQNRGRTFVDVETTGTHPAKGDIVEVGVIVTEADGTVVEEFERQYDTARNVAGLARMVPLFHAHNISVPEVAGRPVLMEDGDDDLLDVLCDPDQVLVAHNTNFEGQWFTALSKVFWNTRSIFSQRFASSHHRVASFQDTKYLSSLCVDSKGNRLKDFVEVHGDSYVGAHRALADTRMMMDAFYKFLATTE